MIDLAFLNPGVAYRVHKLPCVTACLPSHPVSSPATPSRRRQNSARRSRQKTVPDQHLLHRAREVAKLSAARKTLRKRHGSEPTIADAISLAARGDGTVSLDLDEWRHVFDARNEITVKWLWLVAAVARKAYRTYLEAFPEMSAALSLADITQEGVCGLMTSVERWDPRKDYAFDAFAFYSIKHAILRAIENQSRPIRLPVHVLNKLSKMRKIRIQLNIADDGEEPSVEDVARLAGVNRREAELYLDRSKTLCSIDAPLRRSGVDAVAPTLREFLVDHSVDVARQVERVCTREAVQELVQSSDLEELERSVLLLKYGLSDGVERVRADVSRLLDVRVEKVRRAELSALKKLRDTMGEDLSGWTGLIS